MKKSIVLAAFMMALVSCNKTESEKAASASSASTNTAYVDTAKLMEENFEAKDIKAKFDAILEEKGKRFDAEVAQFQSEAANFEKNAQQYGMQWAQKKGEELRKKEQYLAQQEQLIVREAQFEGGKEMDSLVKRVKNFIKDYGKDKGYDYIYGTGESANVLYAKDEFDITDEIIKLLNDKYKPSEVSSKDKTEAKDEKK